MNSNQLLTVRRTLGTWWCLRYSDPNRVRLASWIACEQSKKTEFDVYDRCNTQNYHYVTQNSKQLSWFGNKTTETDSFISRGAKEIILGFPFSYFNFLFGRYKKLEKQCWIYQHVDILKLLCSFCTAFVQAESLY